MDAHAVHLAMAALVGASIVAVSAYYMHRKTLAQLMEFARAVELDGGSDGGDSPLHSKKRRGGSKRRMNGSYQRFSASLPDVMAISGGLDGNGTMHVEGIPAGLPRLQTLREGIVIHLFESFFDEIELCYWLLSWKVYMMNEFFFLFSMNDEGKYYKHYFEFIHLFDIILR